MFHLKGNTTVMDYDQINHNSDLINYMGYLHSLDSCKDEVGTLSPTIVINTVIDSNIVRENVSFSPLPGGTVNTTAPTKLNTTTGTIMYNT